MNILILASLYLNIYHLCYTNIYFIFILWRLKNVCKRLKTSKKVTLDFSVPAFKSPACVCLHICFFKCMHTREAFCLTQHILMILLSSNHVNLHYVFPLHIWQSIDFHSSINLDLHTGDPHKAILYIRKPNQAPPPHTCLYTHYSSLPALSKSQAALTGHIKKSLLSMNTS